MDMERDLIGEASAQIARTHYQTIVNGGGHTLLVDEPVEKGGTDTGMSPLHLLLSSLASCTAITLRMYAERKMWLIDEISVDLELYKKKDGIFIESKLKFKGELTEEQTKRLITIADACPIHKMLVGNITINTSINNG